MTASARPGPVRRALARLVPDSLGAAHRSGLDPAVGPDRRLPEQRLLDVATRYGRQAIGDHPPAHTQSAAAAGVKVVPPTDPSDAGAPVWVRRLGDRDESDGPSPGGRDLPTESPVARRGPRPSRSDAPDRLRS